MKYRLTILLLTISLFCMDRAYTQDESLSMSDTIIDHPLNQKMSILLQAGASTAGKETFGVFGAGIHLTKPNIEFTLNVHPRFNRNQVWIQESENLYYQYNETALMFSVGTAKGFQLADYLELYAGVNAGLYRRNYRGVADAATYHFVPVPQAGARVGLFGPLWLKLGAEYLKVKESATPAVRGAITLQVFLRPVRIRYPERDFEDGYEDDYYEDDDDDSNDGP